MGLGRILESLFFGFKGLRTISGSFELSILELSSFRSSSFRAFDPAALELSILELSSFRSSSFRSCAARILGFFR